MLQLLVLNVVLCATSAANLNWDPGLRRQDAANFDLSSPHYFEDCKTSGSCRGNLPAGSGFYTLAYATEDVSTFCCKPNTGQPITDGQCPSVSGQPCAYYFFWGNDFGRVISDTLAYSVPAYIYFGLQETLPTGDSYGGLPNNNIPARNLGFLQIEYRTKVCYPSPSAYAHGTFHYYVQLWNSAQNRGVEFRFNLLAFWQTPDGQAPAESPWYHQKIWNENAINPRQWVWNLNGQMFGWSPNWSPWIDPTGATCSSPLENSPWRSWRINIQAVFNELISGGYEPQSFFDGAIFSGSIVGGVETWGTSYAAMDVRQYFLTD